MLDIFDTICAERLVTDVDTFISKTEATTEWRRGVIISCALESNDKKKYNKPVGV